MIFRASGSHLEKVHPFLNMWNIHLKSPLEVKYLGKKIAFVDSKFLLFLGAILEMAAILKSYVMGP